MGFTMPLNVTSPSNYTNEAVSVVPVSSHCTGTFYLSLFLSFFLILSLVLRALTDSECSSSDLDRRNGLLASQLFLGISLSSSRL